MGLIYLFTFTININQKSSYIYIIIRSSHGSVLGVVFHGVFHVRLMPQVSRIYSFFPSKNAKKRMSETNAWMSQEVNKWLVNGL